MTTPDVLVPLLPPDLLPWHRWLERTNTRYRRAACLGQSPFHRHGDLAGGRAQNPIAGPSRHNRRSVRRCRLRSGKRSR